VQRHDGDVTSLVFGLIFAAVAVSWGAGELGWASWPDAATAGPIALIAAGVVGVATSLRQLRRRPAVAATDVTDVAEQDADPPIG
jgi:hypothetical protein